ncbi:MAG: PPOX class F420-dependent oxidoreductase [Acidimicrobiales bacterium]
MDVAEARRFLETHHRAVLVTARQNGRPQASPVLFCVDDEGRVLVSTREGAAKTANTRRDPAVSLCVLADDFFSAWVQVDGKAEVVPLPDALDLLVDYYRRISGEHPDWDEYRAAMEEQRRVVLRVEIERAGGGRGR